MRTLEPAAQKAEMPPLSWAALGQVAFFAKEEIEEAGRAGEDTGDGGRGGQT